MSKIGIFYGSSTGTTEDIANRIADQLGVAGGDIYDVAEADAADADAYDTILLGSSTWGDGELQDDWYDFMEELKEHLDGKKVGFFGTGDSDSYADSFCDAVGILYDEVADSGCTTIGSMPTDGYNYEESLAERNGHFVGLLIDEVNEDDMTDERIEAWVKTIK